ncbi:VOC family protein [Gryllotalpicola protaetiae]|uniref:Putative pterin-4-alpha-carbinolamine dehydratase n=1 Tax=Gryllotalpicola protaetiae TaxID=2419771 RepID=A0A387BUR4_9MICO|nr:VOC family protein [Gryllotalpicola protaetiae]AYG04816.1 4a-hydroxytetrahydrobiopterin dehydratase [Gryllotalpicola protaetiae]
MVEVITSQRFHAAPGVEDWRVLSTGAAAHFVTGSFATGVALVDRIGELAEAANHHPDVELRYGGVTVRLLTHEVMEQGWVLSERDSALAAQISHAARELGITADPTKVQAMQIAIDALDIPKVRPFWAAVLGYELFGDEDVGGPGAVGPNVWFQQMDEPRPQRNRIHVDLYVPADLAPARIEAALAAGGTVVLDNGPEWWTLADPEGNEVDVAPWPDTFSGW